jgi:nucleoid DNA-binding protein
VLSFYHHGTKTRSVASLTKLQPKDGGPEMIKQDLIQRVVERTGLPRTKAEAAVDAIFESMKQNLIAGDRIELRGFGVFTVKPRKTGIGRNPRTGAEVTIAPGKAVRFKPGKELHLLD